MDMRDGDIFSWRWKSDDEHVAGKPWGSYHCKSRIAVCKNGVLRDTYWHGGDNYAIDQAEVALTFRGNLNDLVEVPYYFAKFYKKEDLVDMRHANNTNGVIYRKPDSVRDAATMLELAKYERDKAESDIKSAQHRIEWIDAQIERIVTGKIDEVTL